MLGKARRVERPRPLKHGIKHYETRVAALKDFHDACLLWARNPEEASHRRGMDRAIRRMADAPPKPTVDPRMFITGPLL